MNVTTATYRVAGPVPRGYRFGNVARMEWIKLRSVRSSWWLLAFVLLAMVATGTGVGVGYRGHTPVATMAQIVDNSLGGAVLAQLLSGALGALVVTGEYASGMIRATFAANPRRGLVLAAKAAVFGSAAIATGVVSSVAAFAAGQIAISGTAVPHASLADPRVLRPVLLTGVYLAVVGLLGMGFGAVIRHSGGAIGALFGAMFVPLFVAGMFGSSGIGVSRFVPVIILANSVITTAPVPGTLSAWAGIAVMGLYAAFTLGLGALLLIRRDV
jgi:ABC-type transport system involved in multi-copper enzyme maturation permease subunit